MLLITEESIAKFSGCVYAEGETRNPKKLPYLQGLRGTPIQRTKLCSDAVHFGGVSLYTDTQLAAILCLLFSLSFFFITTTPFSEYLSLYLSFLSPFFFSL